MRRIYYTPLRHKLNNANNPGDHRVKFKDKEFILSFYFVLNFFRPDENKLIWLALSVESRRAFHSIPLEQMNVRDCVDYRPTTRETVYDSNIFHACPWGVVFVVL